MTMCKKAIHVREGEMHLLWLQIGVTPDISHQHVLFQFITHCKDISAFDMKESFIECIGGEQAAEMLITSLRNHNISLDDYNGQGFDNGCNGPEK